MRVSYGPPGAKGVTHLVAIGDTDPQTSSLEKKVSGGGLLAMAIGAVMGNKRTFWAGAGVAGGILLVRWLRSNQKVEIAAVNN